jgi:uncharacterized protein (DUF983 family)
MSKKKMWVQVILQCRCPQCHEGLLFNHKNPYDLSQKILDMKTNCEVCGQKTELETGFWFGTGYVSYGLSIGVVVINMLLFTGIVGWQGDFIYIYFLVYNALVLTLLMPLLMRYSRMIWLSAFVSYIKK